LFILFCNQCFESRLMSRILSERSLNKSHKFLFQFGIVLKIVIVFIDPTLQ
jgi:hypothetical protein